MRCDFNPCYRERTDGEVSFCGQKKPKCLEIFSLSVDRRARGLGVGAKEVFTLKASQTTANFSEFCCFFKKS